MNVEHTIEENGDVRVCVNKGHLKVCGWVTSWHLCEAKQAQIARLLDMPQEQDQKQEPG